MRITGTILWLMMCFGMLFELSQMKVKLKVDLLLKTSSWSLMSSLVVNAFE